MLLDFNFSLEKDVAQFDINLTALDILRRIDLSKFIDFQNYCRAYDPVMMLTVIILVFSEHGYASLRELESLYRYDLRYRIITNGSIPSYKSFE